MDAWAGHWGGDGGYQPISYSFFKPWALTAGSSPMLGAAEERTNKRRSLTLGHYVFTGRKMMVMI